jgi:hypothetical protein
MPIKSVSEVKFGIMIDGEFKPILEIPELSANGALGSTDDLSCDHDFSAEMTGSFAIKRDRNYRRFMRSVNRMFTAPSNKSNN